MNAYMSMLLGVICAGVGGEFFVKAVVSVAKKARIAPRIVATTVAAFATSSPELSVSINSALAGHPEIAFGNALGANVINIALILAIALIVAGMNSPRESVRRDFPVAFMTPVLMGVLALDGELSRIDGLLMLGMFVTWLVVTLTEAHRMRRSTAKSEDAFHPWRMLGLSVTGLVLLFMSGNLIVDGASRIAESFGIEPFVVGATIVAIGTTMPELATTLISLYRGHDEIGLGTILGSNIFNGLFIVSIAAIIHPIQAEFLDTMTALTFGAIVIGMAYPDKSGRLGRRRGILLIGIYVVYLVTILQRGGQEEKAPVPAAATPAAIGEPNR